MNKVNVKELLNNVFGSGAKLTCFGEDGMFGHAMEPKAVKSAVAHFEKGNQVSDNSAMMKEIDDRKSREF